eukprot:gnl/Chilomastix_cuspidata/2652.p1 GENE.gnl/Chilomastix_cuspidata/2652~~gnl/Chilomastix_cuspidata/2652.p1  ORF type:complete len:351 (+),score=117.25 gnl/Chilomastix_cuspidata/2652:36-1055(+)
MSGDIFFDKHIEFATKKSISSDKFSFVFSEFLRLSSIYWGISIFSLIGDPTDIHSVPEIQEKIMTCYCPEACAFSPSPGHDPHLLYTTSALQVLALYDALDCVRDLRAGLIAAIAALQQPDGSFHGDDSGEVDSRFAYCALVALALLGVRVGDTAALGAVLDAPALVAWLRRCFNEDGGVGVRPGGESHGGQCFTVFGALSVLRRLDVVPDPARSIEWLVLRQTPLGGFNGRPDKLPDVCYSWWILACLCILRAEQHIDQPRLERFILACQDTEQGGISDRPENRCDVYHTFFGLAGLSMLRSSPRLQEIDPAYALPAKVCTKLGLNSQRLETSSHGAA